MDDLMAPIGAEKKYPKPKKKKRAKGKGPNQLDAGNPKHHLVHVHVNVVNNSEAGGSGKKKNEADEALSRLRGF